MLKNCDIMHLISAEGECRDVALLVGEKMCTNNFAMLN